MLYLQVFIYLSIYLFYERFAPYTLEYDPYITARAIIEKGNGADTYCRVRDLIAYCMILPLFSNYYGYPLHV